MSDIDTTTETTQHEASTSADTSAVISLQDAKIGDKVYFNPGRGQFCSLHEISHATAKWVVIGDPKHGSKFRRSDGELVGGSSWQTEYIAAYDPAQHDRILADHAATRARNHTIKRLREFDWRRLPAEQIAQIAAMIDQYEADEKVARDAAQIEAQTVAQG